MAYRYMELGTDLKDIDEFLTEKFGNNCHHEFIWLAEYIRSFDELNIAAESCLAFLQKHNLADNPPKNQVRLFSVVTLYDYY